MDAKTVDEIAALRIWLEELTGKSAWVRRIDGKFIAVIEQSPPLKAETYQEARAGWEHALDRWGWTKCP